MLPAKRKIEERDSNIFGQLLFMYLPYWPLFLMLLLLFGGAAFFYLKYTTPLYQTTARILIKDEKKGAEESKAIEDIDRLSTKKIIENEMEVIQSRMLISDVVKALHLYAPVYTAQKIKNTSAYATSPVKLQVLDMDHYIKADNIEFTYNAADSVVMINNMSFPLNKWVPTKLGTLKFTSNEDFKGLTNGEKLFFSLKDPEAIAANIQKNLKVEAASKMSSILKLSLLDEVPERGEDVLNELIKAYNNAIIKDKNILAKNTLGFIEGRLKSVEHDLDSVERKIQQYKTTSGSVDIGMQGRLFLENVSSNDQKLSELNMQLAVLNGVESYLNGKDNKAGIVPSTLGVSDPVLSQLVNQLYSAELEYESMKKVTAENNPLLVAVADRIEKIRPNISENIKSQKSSLIASKGNLLATNQSYSSVLRSIPKRERDLININREQSIKNEIYTYLLQKKEETALSYASTVTDSRVVEGAVTADTPVSPKAKVIYLSALLAALFSGIGVVTARESFSQKIMFRHQIEKLTESPIIGEIGSERNKEVIVIGDDKKTFIAEQFRKLRMTLNYIGVNSKRKRILVTSAIPGEGKSFVASNLALSLSITGKKVILLDFDLNNPSLHKKINVHNSNGISDYLLGKSEAEDIISPTDLHPELHFISTGKLPYNPTELLMNGRVEELLNYLDAVYDYIVIDTAPVHPVTDAYVLSPLCDATLFVIRHKYTPKVFVERIDENNKINRLTNVAIVFNGVQPRGWGKKEYGYGYGYGYVYRSQYGAVQA